MYGTYMYQYSYLVEQVEVLLSQFEWNSRDSPTETRLTDQKHRFFVIRDSRQFPARRDRTAARALCLPYVPKKLALSVH